MKLLSSHYCGGSILTKRFLLTAAHCTMYQKADPSNVFALVGAFRQSEGGVRVELDTITPHAGFSLEQLVNDIALIRTAEEITFTDLIQPIALPTSPIEATARVVLSGWGKHRVSYPISISLLSDKTKWKTVTLIDKYYSFLKT